MATERELQAALLLAAPHRIPALRLFRRNIGAVRVEGRVIRFATKGMCDLHGYFRGGQGIEIELKAFGRLSPEQLQWQAFCKEWGIPHLVLRAREGESVSETVERWCGEIASLASASSAS